MPPPSNPGRKPNPSPSTKRRGRNEARSFPEKKATRNEDAVLMNKMIVANLVYRPLRSAISMVAVAVEVTLILLIVGLSTGILNDNKTRQAGIGADIMVKPPGSSFMTGLTGAPVPIKVADILRKQPHIAAVTPVVTQLTAGANIEIIYGIDVPSF